MQPQNEKGWMKDSEEIREKRDKDAKKEQCGDTKQRRTKKKNQREIMWEKVHHKGKAAAEG